jgi:hypothetical protein
MIIFKVGAPYINSDQALLSRFFVAKVPHQLKMILRLFQQYLRIPPQKYNHLYDLGFTKVPLLMMGLSFIILESWKFLIFMMVEEIW